MAGFLQAGIYASLDGHLGLAGWRWLYISKPSEHTCNLQPANKTTVCGCMSLPVAMSVWFLLPDYPHNTKAWYITEEDKRLTIQRAAKQDKSDITGIIDLKLARRMFGNWRWWALCSVYIFVSRRQCQSNSVEA